VALVVCLVFEVLSIRRAQNEVKRIRKAKENTQYDNEPVSGTSQRSQNIFHQVLVTSKISNLATSV